ncbi:hypothetical protein BU23DRAFT_450977, partial [Bimuria novae-zelandiae CBS 107.79]
RAAAKAYNIPIATLSRRVRGSQNWQNSHVYYQILNQQQETELLQYIKQLTKRGLPPTRYMIQTFASQIA